MSCLCPDTQHGRCIRQHQGRIQEFHLGGHEAPKAPRSSAAGARIEAPQAPRGVGRNFSILHYKMACFGRFWCATCTVDRCYRGGFNDRFWLTTDVKALINCNIRCRHHYAFGGAWPLAPSKSATGDRRDMPRPYAARCGPAPAHTRLTPGLRRPARLVSSSCWRHEYSRCTRQTSSDRRQTASLLYVPA